MPIVVQFMSESSPAGSKERKIIWKESCAPQQPSCLSEKLRPNDDRGDFTSYPSVRINKALVLTASVKLTKK